MAYVEYRKHPKLFKRLRTFCDPQHLDRLLDDDCRDDKKRKAFQRGGPQKPKVQPAYEKVFAKIHIQINIQIHIQHIHIHILILFYSGAH